MLEPTIYNLQTTDDYLASVADICLHLVQFGIELIEEESAPISEKFVIATVARKLAELAQYCGASMEGEEKSY